MSWNYVLICTAHTLTPQKTTKYLNLHINILQIYVLEQQVQSTSYSHHVDLSCNEKLKS